MRLKRVRIFGFKTFAEKTEFSLEGGFVAVVGPNGCGKSNLVDAILWGLGEGNSRNLRAQTGQDVIFSGSTAKKAVGFAEVSLLFDNEDGALPIDTPEVTITRRLNRAGEGEYFINRIACRQRDIHELLADSGLGRAGYSIVGQKEIDQALAASAEDRRAWVDEAAGVQRYRARKQDALKRLSSAKDHLSRVDDILHELDQQREPLRAEAQVAARYRAISSSLREIETGLLIQDLSRAVVELAELEQRLRSAAETARAESVRAEALDEEDKALREVVARRDRELEDLRVRLQDTLKGVERSEGSVKLSGEKLNSLDQLEETLRHQNREVTLNESEAELHQADLMLNEAEQELADAQKMIGGAGEAAQRLHGLLAAAERELQGARDASAARLKAIAENEHRRERRKEALRELEGIQKDLPQLERAVTEATAEQETLEGALERSQQRERLGVQQLRELDGEIARSSSRSRELLAERAALEGRRRGIEATLAANEGLTQGSRAVLEAARTGKLEGHFTPVGEAMQTERTYALALETALGATANDLIVDSDSDAKGAIAYLKQNRLGRATFQPLNLIRRNDVNQELRRLLTSPGIIGRASELLTCDSRFRPVFESLLGKVLVISDLDSSLRLAKTYGWSRLVTLEGEVVHASGAVTGGVQARANYGLVQRKADLKELHTQIDRLDQSLREAEIEMSKVNQLRAETETEMKLERAKLEDLVAEIRNAKQLTQTLQLELAQGRRSLAKLESELDLLVETSLSTDSPNTDELQAKRDSLIEQLASKSADANQAQQKLRDAEKRVREANTHRAACLRRLESAKASVDGREARLAGLSNEREKLRMEMKRHQEARDRQFALSRQFQAELRDVQVARDKASQSSFEKNEQAKRARETLSALASANHQSELARARAEGRRAVAEERLLEEYGIGAEEALLQAQELVVPADAAPLASRLRREIKAMGIVNLGAIEAFERLTARYEELTSQRSDIVEGIEQVLHGMRALDQLTRDRFLDTFKQVQEAYSEIFCKLFGGGEGQIILDAPDNILESGIEIEVTLPGKKKQKLELLSGGERALCASAFLFALLQTKPSPLVVLDEVDAPLDGRNVERFATLLEEFSKSTQFIVITHNPTTIERAPVWLGVTMQEAGVSTLVPARLPAAS